jgi:hypothetical protein
MDKRESIILYGPVLKNGARHQRLLSHNSKCLVIDAYRATL